MKPRLEQKQIPFRMSLFTLTAVLACSHCALSQTIGGKIDPIGAHEYRENGKREGDFSKLLIFLKNTIMFDVL